MFKTCLENRIIRRETSYKCYLCHYEIKENNFESVLEHIKANKHKQKYNEIDEDVKKTVSERLCTVSETTRRKIVENHVTYGKGCNIFLCRVCNYNIDGLSNVIYHIKEDAHKQCLKETTNKQCTKKADNSHNALRSDIKELIHQVNRLVTVKHDQNISFDEATKLSYCRICNCNISGLSNVSQHINGYYHKARLLDLSLLQDKKKSASEKENVSAQKSFQSPFIDIHYCTPCQIFLKTPLALQSHVMQHLHNELTFSCNVDIIKFYPKALSKGLDPGLKCLLCQLIIPDIEQLQGHLETSMHLDRLNHFSYIKDNLKFDDVNIEINNGSIEQLKFNSAKCLPNASLCTVCNITLVNNSFDLKSHLTGKKHITNIEKNPQSNSDKENTKKNSIVGLNFYPCFLCQLSFSSVLLLLNHYKTGKHKLKIKCFNLINECPHTRLITSKRQEIILCNLCNTRMPNFRVAIEHILGKKHIGKENNKLYLNNNENSTTRINNADTLNSKILNSKKTTKKIEFKTSAEELIRLGFSVEHLDYLESDNSVNDVLNDLVKLDLDKSQQKKLPFSAKPRKLRKPQSENKMSVFNKTVLLFGKSFIKLCIDSGEDNIYNVDSEKLRLIKLGVTLAFPWESQQVCLACGLQFPSDKQSLFEHVQDPKHIKDLYEMEANHKVFEEYPDQFSDLELAKFYMSDISDEFNDSVKCFACDMDVKNNNADICLHVDKSDHISNSQIWKEESEKIWHEYLNIFQDIWYYAQVFVCEFCKVNFDLEIDFIKHLENEKHIKKVIELKMNKTAANFYSCPICITYWYGYSNSYSIHCQDKFHIRFAQNRDFMIPEMPVATKDLLSNVNTKIDSLISISNNVLMEKCRESELLKAIEETVENVYPKAKAYVFGSRLSHLGFPDSDVDVFLDCNKVYYKCTTQEESQQYLLSVKEYFETNPNIWIVDEILLGTRVPIMKLRHIPTTLKCDISFVNGLSVEKSKLIRCYNEAYPMCRKLILYLKKWLATCQLSGSDGITTFAISWYVIFYLQVKKILPSVHKLLQLKNETKVIGGWECGFSETFSVAPSDLSFQAHLYEFFSYYANFDFKTNVVCPYIGKTIQKRTFAYYEQLPQEMELYKHHLQQNNIEIFRFDSPMCIQDPIDLFQNMTKAVKKQQLRCFRQYCTESAKKVL